MWSYRFANAQPHAGLSYKHIMYLGLGPSSHRCSPFLVREAGVKTDKYFLLFEDNAVLHKAVAVAEVRLNVKGRAGGFDFHKKYKR